MRVARPHAVRGKPCQMFTLCPWGRGGAAVLSTAVADMSVHHVYQWTVPLKVSIPMSCPPTVPLPSLA